MATATAKNKQAQSTTADKTITQKAQSTSLTKQAPAPNCLKCNDSGWFPTGVANRVERCGCSRERAIRAALDPMYHTASLADFKRGTQELVSRWLVEPTVGLLLFGNVGSGKTHLAASILRVWYETGKKAKFLRAADLYLQIRRTYSAPPDQSSEFELLLNYCQTPLLIMDDLGAGSTSDHERRIALEVLDRRMNQLLPTIVTTNWTLEKIEELMDERIASRLSKFEPIGFTGADRRKRTSQGA